jgi:hypothetical protein
MPPQQRSGEQQGGGPANLVMDQFAGINTSAARASIKDEQMWWCDGFMPLGPGNLRTLYDVGPSQFVVTGETITKMFCTNGSIYVWTNSAPSGAGSIYRLLLNSTTPPTVGLNFKIANSNIDSYVDNTGACQITPGDGAVVFVSLLGFGYAIFTGGVFYGPGQTAPSFGVVPSGFGGSSAETYSGHLWVADGPVLLATAPGSFIDFATTDGGVDVGSTDSNLRSSYLHFKALGGFLYLIADSSVFYISGVQTSGIPATTTYSYQNADATIGTTWPDSVIDSGRDLLIANPTGIFRLYGSDMVRISSELDGFYTSVPLTSFPIIVANSHATHRLSVSAAQANIFGRRVWMFLVPIIDQVTNVQVNKLLMTDGKIWWTSSQSVNLTYITTFEAGSQLYAIGTDGTHVYVLFQTPSSTLTKTVQSKLWQTPEGYHIGKSDTRFWGLANYYSTVSTNLTVQIENETQIPGAATYTITGPSSTGYFVTPPQAIGQQGVLSGMNIKTNAADMQLVSAMIRAEEVQYRG